MAKTVKVTLASKPPPIKKMTKAEKKAAKKAEKFAAKYAKKQEKIAKKEAKKEAKKAKKKGKKGAEPATKQPPTEAEKDSKSVKNGATNKELHMNGQSAKKGGNRKEVQIADEPAVQAPGVCHMECERVNKAGKGGGEEITEFIGPVKIVLVDMPPEAYRDKLVGIAWFTVAHYSVGFVMAGVLFFALTFRNTFYTDVHIMFCSIGYCLFFTPAVMILNPLFGGSVLEEKDRKYEHMLLSAFGSTIASFGILCIYVREEVNTHTHHSNCGVLSVLLWIAAIVTGVIPYFELPIHKLEWGPVEFIREIHLGLGTASYVTAFLSFCTGVMKPTFIATEFVKDLHLLMIMFGLIFGSAGIASPYWKP